jgi:hypothetical protein
MSATTAVAGSTATWRSMKRLASSVPAVQQDAAVVGDAEGRRGHPRPRRPELCDGGIDAYRRGQRRPPDADRHAHRRWPDDRIDRRGHIRWRHPGDAHLEVS